MNLDTGNPQQIAERLERAPKDLDAFMELSGKEQELILNALDLRRSRMHQSTICGMCREDPSLAADPEHLDWLGHSLWVEGSNTDHLGLLDRLLRGSGLLCLPRDGSGKFGLDGLREALLSIREQRDFDRMLAKAQPHRSGRKKK